MQQAFFTFESTCSTCGGSGQLVKVLCIICYVFLDLYFLLLFSEVLRATLVSRTINV